MTVKGGGHDSACASPPNQISSLGLLPWCVRPVCRCCSFGATSGTHAPACIQMVMQHGASPPMSPPAPACASAPSPSWGSTGGSRPMGGRYSAWRLWRRVTARLTYHRTHVISLHSPHRRTPFPLPRDSSILSGSLPPLPLLLPNLPQRFLYSSTYKPFILCLPLLSSSHSTIYYTRLRPAVHSLNLSSRFFPSQYSILSIPQPRVPTLGSRQPTRTQDLACTGSHTNSVANDS